MKANISNKSFEQKRDHLKKMISSFQELCDIGLDYSQQVEELELQLAELSQSLGRKS